VSAHIAITVLVYAIVVVCSTYTAAIARVQVRCRLELGRLIDSIGREVSQPYLGRADIPYRVRPVCAILTRAQVMLLVAVISVEALNVLMVLPINAR